MVMRRAGNASPDAIKAERTRSRASDTALSGRPTMVKAGMPGATWTWTSTGRTSMPSNETVETRWTMSAPVVEADYPKRLQVARTIHEHNPMVRYARFDPVEDWPCAAAPFGPRQFCAKLSSTVLTAGAAMLPTARKLAF